MISSIFESTWLGRFYLLFTYLKTVLSRNIRFVNTTAMYKPFEIVYVLFKSMRRYTLPKSFNCDWSCDELRLEERIGYNIIVYTWVILVFVSFGGERHLAHVKNFWKWTLELKNVIAIETSCGDGLRTEVNLWRIFPMLKTT